MIACPEDPVKLRRDIQPTTRYASEDTTHPEIHSLLLSLIATYSEPWASSDGIMLIEVRDVLQARVEIDSLISEILLRHQRSQSIKAILGIDSLRYRIQIVDLALVSRTDEGVHRLRGSEARSSLRATTPTSPSATTTARTTRAC